MRAFLVFLVAGVGTYLSRAVFVLAVGARDLPPRAERALRNIGPAVLASLTASLLTTRGTAPFLADTAAVLGCVAGVAVGLWRRAFLGSFVAAVAVWWVVGLLV